MTQPNVPTSSIAADVVAAMTHEPVLSSMRMTTGDQHFVFAVQTAKTEYVLRMTDLAQHHKFVAAIYWQKKLLPLGIPLARFIQTDLDGHYSAFPALLMLRLPGNDLINVYTELTSLDKKNLALEICQIQHAMMPLPKGRGYGLALNYEENLPNHSWHDFLIQRLQQFKQIFADSFVFSSDYLETVFTFAEKLRANFEAVPATPFLWDASERNVIVTNGKITGIVDVDEICFGDPLFVIALTCTALKNEGFDTLYTDYWTKFLNLDAAAEQRLAFYNLFFIIVFMRKHSMLTANRQTINFNVDRLKNIYQDSLDKITALF